MYDITKKRASETAQITIKNPDGTVMRDDKGNALKATIYGPGSETYHAGQAELARKRQERIRETDGDLTSSVAGGIDDLHAFLAAMTISFDGWEYPHPEKDKKWPGGREMFLACYSDRRLGYIRDQINTEVNNWAAFMRGSAAG